MPFTTCSQASLNAGDGGAQASYFHPEDISIVMSQPDAVGVTSMNAVVSGVNCKVLVAVSVLNTDGTIAEKLDGPNHLMAIACPPFNKKGGIFEPVPVPAPSV